MRSRTVRRGGLLGLATAAALVVGAVPAYAAPGDGSAYVAGASVTLLGQAPITVGPLAPSNAAGPTSASLVNIPGPLITAGVVTSAASLDESTGAVHAEANVANANVALGGLSISADAVNVDCDATQDGTTGSTVLANVVLPGGTVVPANPAPNTVIAVPSAPLPALVSITFNEQINNADGSLTVNGIHVRLNALLGTGDVIVSHAQCGPAALPVPLASGAGLWIGLGLLGLIAVPVGVVALRRRAAATAAL